MFLRPLGTALPGGGQHRTLQDKRFRIGRPAEAVQQALEGVAYQDSLQLLRALLSEAEQSGLHGGGQVTLWGRVHVRLSRYGRITLATRQNLAEGQRASILERPPRPASP